VVAEFLEAQFEPFFAQYQALLDSTNYVTRRLSLKLLGELLLRPDNKPVMVSARDLLAGPWRPRGVMG
jgi:calcium binding protein 39